MKKRKFFGIFILIFAMACSSEKNKPEPFESIDLNGVWEFKETGDSLWMSAIVPGCVHTDLMSNNIIPDPYFRCNEDSVQWVSTKTWEYRKNFTVNFNPSDFNHLDLYFEGIDTYARIFLNRMPLSAQTLSGQTNNMFRRWRFDVSKTLKKGENEMVVVFSPPKEIIQTAAAKLPYALPESRAFSRKAPYQFGWDWGPTLITCGIWKPAKIEVWNDFKIEDLYLEQMTLSERSAQINMNLELYSDIQKKIFLDILVDNKAIVSAESFLLKKGINNLEKIFEISNPEFWYLNGMGNQKRYQVKVVVKNDGYSRQIAHKIGLRVVSLERKKDSIGESFTFLVNGKPTFMKGSNYIPQDNFPSRVTPERHRKLLTLVKNANMNMLRVWGGGIYEDDCFYDLCDSLGILIWQDFLFSCALYPSDSAFLSSVAQEAADQVKRLRNHPSIALWCGNNEVKNGWEDWGWQQQYTEQQRKEIWSGNVEIFEKILPQTVQKLHATCSYHASSPEWGWGHPQCNTEGDSHYWGVWWGEEPFSVWENKTGRFMSEYGFQSMPSLSVIESMATPSDFSLHSAIMKNHQKHPRGFALIDAYMERDYTIPKRFSDYLYVSQLLQAHGIGQALEIHRRKKPHCMGTLYWQLNDCWPVVSWSSIDSDYNPKALYYSTLKCFEPIIINVLDQDNILYFYLVSDLQSPVSGALSIQWMDFSGKTFDEQNIKCTAPENASALVYKLPKSIFEKHKESSLLSLRFLSDNGKEAEKIYYFDIPKNLQLPNYHLNANAEQQQDKVFITVSSNTLVKNLYFYASPSLEGWFSDNFFDLLPFETKTIEFFSSKKIDAATLEKSLHSISLKDVQ